MVKIEQFAGANTPEDMGTTGLVAWALLGGPKHSRIFRLKRAMEVVFEKKRRTGLLMFIDCLLIEENTQDLREEIDVVTSAPNIKRNSWT